MKFLFIIIIMNMHICYINYAHSAGGQINGSIYQSSAITGSSHFGISKNNSINSIDNTGKIYGDVVQIYESDRSVNIDAEINRFDNDGVITGQTIQRNNLDTSKIIIR